MIERTSLTQIASQPTRDASLLDRIFISDPQLYPVVRVVTSVVKSDHKAIVAIPEGAAVSVSNTRQKRTFRPTPSQNASFLQRLAAADLSVQLDPGVLTQDGDPQKYYNTFYATPLDLLETFYPERTITVCSRDPAYVTPYIKAKLRRKNRLM